MRYALNGSEEVPLGYAWLALVLLVSACCGSSRTVEVEVPERSAVNSAVDSLLQVRPHRLPPVRARTLPERVVTYAEPDTTSPATEVTAVTATPDAITIRTRWGELSYRPPAKGETLVLESDSTGGFEAGVAGEQEERTVEVEVSDREGTPWWKWLSGALVVSLVLVFLIRLLT